MAETNYLSPFWGWIYDQVYEDMSDWVENNRLFYRAQLEGVTGPVLECACGTGLMFLPLLEAGVNMYGFDISESMLGTLRRKALERKIQGIEERISVQDFETFHYVRHFDAVTIPTNAFAHLTTQEAQIRTLRNIYAHLSPGGRLLLDLRHPGLRELVEQPDVVEGSWYTWTHPETGRPIRQRMVGRTDFDRQLVLDTCTFEYDGQVEEISMSGRWIYKEEFTLLLRLAGFSSWQAFGTPQGGPLELGRDEIISYWVAQK
jgi:SAM-dependent methyltransferase